MPLPSNGLRKKIQGASTSTTRCTPSTSPTTSAAAAAFTTSGQRHHAHDMAAHVQLNNGLYDGHEYDDGPSAARYHESFITESEYSVETRMSTPGPWKKRPDERTALSDDYDGFDFTKAFNHHTNTTPDSRPASHRISLNTRLRSPQDATPRGSVYQLQGQQQQQQQDDVSRHLLYETALMDTQAFEVLDMGDVDALKKEHERLNSKIEAAQRKLKLESKVRNAAQNLQRLYATKNRPDTPQNPESPKKRRSRTSGGAETLQQAESELADSVKKVDELHETIKDLFDRRQYVERRLLRHTAAVLAEEANKKVDSSMNGRHGDDDGNAYTPDEFDDIRDLLHGRPAGASAKTPQYEQQLASVQDRLEQLNYQLRNVISEASQTLGKQPTAEIGLDQGDDSSTRLENRFVRLEDSLRALEKQQREMKTHYSQGQSTMEEQLEGLNSQLHNALATASQSQAVPDLQEPPQADGHSYKNQLQYMEENLMTMEQLIQHQNQSADFGSKERLEEYENTISGLWNMLQSDAVSPNPNIYTDDSDDEEASTPTFKPSFSLPAFSSLVQNILQRAQSAKEQQEILRRQIQQQRELTGKSDEEKDREIADWQGRHNDMATDHEALQQELANLMVKHQSAESEANRSRGELEKVMGELEEMKKTLDSKQAEREAAADKMKEQIDALETRLAGQTGSQEEMENLESEVVRLTTELTMTKAELDGAYGTRQERQGAQAAEVATLTERNTSLESELQEMTNEFQELTRESIELEKEREGLDALIDQLRERCEGLEGQLSDERLRWVGIKSPMTATAQEATNVKEATSMMVLRQEFKKMMRDQRMEGIKLLRTEQEERRKLEAELRKLRQANGPLPKARAATATTKTTRTDSSSHPTTP